jgi:hypothetical protein
MALTARPLACLLTSRATGSALFSSSSSLSWRRRGLNRLPHAVPWGTPCSPTPPTHWRDCLGDTSTRAQTAAPHTRRLSMCRPSRATHAFYSCFCHVPYVCGMYACVCVCARARVCVRVFVRGCWSRHEWWIPGKILETRRRLQGYCEQADGHRDALMMDCALENWFMTKMTESDKVPPTHTHKHTHTHTHTNTHTHTHTHTYTHTHTLPHTPTHPPTHARAHTHTHPPPPPPPHTHTHPLSLSPHYYF